MADSNREEITKLEALYASNPGGRVFTHLAEAYRKAGNFERARTILEQGITKHADSASAHVVLGRVLSDLGAHEQAAVSYRRVLTLDPENRVALRSLGDLSRQSGESHAALGYYRQLLNLDPSDEDLGTTIEELTRQAARSTAAGADEGAARGPAGAWVEPKPAAAATPPSPAATAVTEDFALDWATQEDEDGLPGDLAHLARAQTAAEPAARASSEVAFPPDIPDRDGTAGRDLEPEPATADTLEAVGIGAAETEMQPASEAIDFAEEQQAAEPSFEDLLSRNVGAAPLAAAGEEPELPTETLADLYRSQGFNDRAAEVYRSLLERKPGDPELERKLAEVEALLPPVAEFDRAPVPSAATFEVVEEETWSLQDVLLDEAVDVEAGQVDEPVAAPAEPETAQAGEAWLEGVASGWTEPGTAAGAATPYAWTDEVAEDQTGGPSLGNYLNKVLSWKPTRTDPPSNSTLSTAPITMGYADATGPLPTGSGSGTAPRAEVGAASSQIAGLEPPVPMTGDDYASRSATPRETAALQPEVIRDPPPAQTIGRTEPASTPLKPPLKPSVALAPPTPSSRPASPRQASGSAIDDAFDEWFSGGENPQPSGSPTSAASAPASVGPTEPAARNEAPAEANAPDEESDDDLEMFRSWLQSLKR